MPDPVDAAVSEAYRSDWGRILATVIRLTGDISIAEESTQEAFESAVGRWRRDGIPEHPRAWLIRLARVVQALTQPEPPAEVLGLLGLLLLHDARRAARVDAAGDVVVLDEQDRSLWDQEQIAEALPLVAAALEGEPGPYALQAAISAAHARARRKQDTDWPEILRLYSVLERLEPSPVVALNRAVAVAMVNGPAAALELVEEIAAGGALDAYHLLHAARADFARRLGALERAEQSYLRALELVGNESERRFLARRLAELRAEAQE